MFIKSLLASALLACGANAWYGTGGDSTNLAGGRCEAHIYASLDSNIDYHIRVFNNADTMGEWDPPLMKPSNTAGTKGVPGTEFRITGNPGDCDSKDALTLAYGSQVWNSKDCREYIYKGSGASNAWHHEHGYWCQFDC